MLRLQVGRFWGPSGTWRWTHYLVRLKTQTFQNVSRLSILIRPVHAESVLFLFAPPLLSWAGAWHSPVSPVNRPSRIAF